VKAVISQGRHKQKQIVNVNDHLIPLDSFHTDLSIWGKDHQRIFPWRTTENPFRILIAELMLRRTQARQVIPVYNQFVAHYPDAEMLAKAPPEEVAEILFPLGLARTRVSADGTGADHRAQWTGSRRL
jgi:adenine-specific DNA glycosylase